jgi:hypothetical protein
MEQTLLCLKNSELASWVGQCAVFFARSRLCLFLKICHQQDCSRLVARFQRVGRHQQACRPEGKQRSELCVVSKNSGLRIDDQAARHSAQNC